MRAIENYNLTIFRRFSVNAPQVIVSLFRDRGHFETGNPHPLRVDSLKHAPDRPIFTGRIYGLKNDQDFMLIFGIQHFLELVEFEAQLYQLRLAAYFIPIPATFIVRVEVFQMNILTLLDAVLIHNASQFLAGNEFFTVFYIAVCIRSISLQSNRPNRALERDGFPLHLANTLYRHPIPFSQPPLSRAACRVQLPE